MPRIFFLSLIENFTTLQAAIIMINRKFIHNLLSQSYKRYKYKVLFEWMMITRCYTDKDVHGKTRLNST